MRKLTLALFILGFSLPSFAQQALFSKTYAFTTTGVTTGDDIRSRGIGQIKVLWANRAASVPSACSFTLQSSPDNSTWTTVSTNTCTTDSQASFASVSTSFIRINLGTYTATASPSVLSITIIGQTSIPGGDVNVAQFGGQSTVLLNNTPEFTPVDKNGNPIDPSVAALITNGDPCQDSTNTFTTDTKSLASTTVLKLIAKTSAKKNYICSFFVQVGGTAEIWSILEGTNMSTECDTGAVALSGSTTLANGNASGANGGVAFGNGAASIIRGKTANNDICLATSGSNRVTITYTWTQK